jgi:hypothetical protein
MHSRILKVGFESYFDKIFKDALNLAEMLADTCNIPLHS